MLRPLPAMEEGEEAQAAPRSSTEGTLRVALTSVAVARADGVVEDDFQSWAAAYIVSSRGVPVASVWPTVGEDAKLGRTSVTNGNEGAYNYVRISKGIALTEGAVSELLSSSLVVRQMRLRIFWSTPC